MSRKIRSREQINEEYNFHVCQAGHKTTNIQLLEEDVKRLEDEVRVHFQKSVALRKEALKLPPVTPGDPEAESVSEPAPSVDATAPEPSETPEIASPEPNESAS